jgi:hypothetical protein
MSSVQRSSWRLRSFPGLQARAIVAALDAHTSAAPWSSAARWSSHSTTAAAPDTPRTPLTTPPLSGSPQLSPMKAIPVSEIVQGRVRRTNPAAAATVRAPSHPQESSLHETTTKRPEAEPCPGTVTMIEQAGTVRRARQQLKGAAAEDTEDGAGRSQAEAWRQRAAEAEAEADVWRVQCARLQVRVAACFHSAREGHMRNPTFVTLFWVGIQCAELARHRNARAEECGTGGVLWLQAQAEPWAQRLAAAEAAVVVAREETEALRRRAAAEKSASDEECTRLRRQVRRLADADERDVTEQHQHWWCAAYRESQEYLNNRASWRSDSPS